MALASNILVGRSSRVQIGAVTVDACLTEGHAIEANVTDHPIEDGSLISDHYKVAPRTISIEAIVSGTPIETGFPGATAIASVKSLLNGDDPVSAAWQEIERYFTEAVMVDIGTKLKTYKKMMLTSFGVIRDAGTGQSLRFSCTAREMKIVQVATVAAIQVAEPKTTVVEIVESKGKIPKPKASAAEKEMIAELAKLKGIPPIP